MSTVPTLTLIPAEGSTDFSTKTISLPAGTTVILGRCSTAAESNGYFAAKAKSGRTPLSRSHAKVWADDDKIFIQDAGSVNGTFVNDRKLEGDERVALKNGDITRLGIWIEDSALEGDEKTPVVASIKY
ncbi:hypothetical protein EW026_g1613 [Hermanssonia centrifuga]|uniref:FHA domain-containing protein n=1 Tax=Hermanssonia centrifuga TaxID=98765 RepID=A0A4V3XB89_9APHY|nr:hypothetical protein EW026_g1613 [Hermanssonia centrifuga]